MAFCTTRTIVKKDATRREKMEGVFLPIVRPDKMDQFLAQWDQWFVLNDSVEQKRCPGLLKSTFRLIYYNLYYNLYFKVNLIFNMENILL